MRASRLLASAEPVRVAVHLPGSGVPAGVGLREPLMQLLAACLDRQVGVHFIDEDDLPALTVADGSLP